MKLKRLIPITNTLCVGGAIAAGAGNALADSAGMDELKARVAQLEALATKEGILPSGTPVPKFVSAMSDISISGFVTASYFYDTTRPADNSPNAYLWNRHSGDFSINKFKLTLASKPVEASGSEWSAGFRASLIWGEDAPIVNTGNYSASVTNTSGGVSTVKSQASAGFEALREAYVEMNVPIGTGLNIKAGQLISLLNYESGDGGAAAVGRAASLRIETRATAAAGGRRSLARGERKRTP